MSPLLFHGFDFRRKSVSQQQYQKWSGIKPNTTVFKKKRTQKTANFEYT